MEHYSLIKENELHAKYNAEAGIWESRYAATKMPTSCMRVLGLSPCSVSDPRSHYHTLGGNRQWLKWLSPSHLEEET